VRNTIALENLEVRANRVVRNSQALSELFHCATATPKLGDDLPACGHEEFAVPLHMMKVGGGADLFNMSSSYLTYSLPISRLTKRTIEQGKKSER
jgi:hypothetical protein